MKGHHFTKAGEFELEIAGEQWSLGETIKGSLQVKPKSDAPMNVQLCLAYGAVAKVKKEGLQILEKIQEFSVTSGKTDWEYTLQETDPFTDKQTALFMVYGEEDVFENGASLLLPVSPHPHAMALVSILETFFRFKIKEKKSKKQGLALKIQIPVGKQWSHLASLSGFLLYCQDTMKLEISAQVKELGHDGHGVVIKKKKKSWSKEWKKDEYLAFGDSLNQEKIVNDLNPIMDELKKQSI